MDHQIIFDGALETSDGCFTKELVINDTRKHIFGLPRDKEKSGFPLHPEAFTDYPISPSRAYTHALIYTLFQALRQPAEQRDTEASQEIKMDLPPEVKLNPGPKDRIVYRFLKALEEIYCSKLSKNETEAWKQYARMLEGEVGTLRRRTEELEMGLQMAQVERRIVQDDHHNTFALISGAEQH